MATSKDKLLELTFIMHLTCGNGAQSLTTDSIPLVASRQVWGWAWTQFTIDSSPGKTRIRLVVWLSHTNRFPSSEPAAMNFPSLKSYSFMLAFLDNVVASTLPTDILISRLNII